MSSFDDAIATPRAGAPAMTRRPAPRTGPVAGWFKRRWRSLLVLLLALTALLLYVGLTRGSSDAAESIQFYTVARRSFPVVLREKGELKASNSIEIRSEVEGRATIISLIEEGTLVKKGDLLVELASEEIDEKIREHEIRVSSARAGYEDAVKSLEILKDKNASEIRKAQLDLELAEMELKKFKEGEAIQQRQDAELALKEAESQLERYTETLKDSEKLYEQKFLTKIELEDARFSKLQAEFKQKKAQLAQYVLENYTIPMGLREKESKVNEARKELERVRKSTAAEEAKSQSDVDARRSELAINEDKLKRYKEQKDKSTIRAPADGLVVYARESWWRSEAQIYKGAQVHERQQIIELPDTRKMKAVVRVHEAQTQKLKLDLPATVEVEGFPGRTFTGRVSKIAAVANSENRWLNPNLKEYETEIMLDGEFTELKPGVTARAEILITEMRDVLAVPVQAVFGKTGGTYYVFVDRDGRTEPVKIETGMASNEYIEVKQGLQPGERVSLVITDDMKLMLPDEVVEQTADFGRPDAERRGSPERSRGARPAGTEAAGTDGKPASRPAGPPASRPAPVSTTQPVQKAARPSADEGAKQ